PNAACPPTRSVPRVESLCASLGRKLFVRSSRARVLPHLGEGCGRGRLPALPGAHLGASRDLHGFLRNSERGDPRVVLSERAPPGPGLPPGSFLPVGHHPRGSSRARRASRERSSLLGGKPPGGPQDGPYLPDRDGHGVLLPGLSS